MQTAALLCDHAQVTNDGKLFVSGAGISRLGLFSAEPPHAVNFALALMTTIEWQETNHPHKMTIELILDQGGEHGAERVPLPSQLPPGASAQDAGIIFAEFNAGRPPNMSAGEQTLMPVALPFPAFPLPAPGSYFFTIKIDGTETARVSFRADVVNQFQAGFGL